jgi:hypothetical protein
MSCNTLTDQATCSDHPFDHFLKRVVGSFIPYQFMVRGQVPRQGIIPGGFPLHLSSLLQIICGFLLLLLRLRELQVMSGSQCMAGYCQLVYRCKYIVEVECGKDWKVVLPQRMLIC